MSLFIRRSFKFNLLILIIFSLCFIIFVVFFLFLFFCVCDEFNEAIQRRQHLLESDEDQIRCVNLHVDIADHRNASLNTTIPCVSACRL